MAAEDIAMDSLPLSRPEILAPAPEDPKRIEAFIPTPCVQNHAAFLARLSGGDLGCVWFGGTQEGVPDIAIRFARLPHGAVRWSSPEQMSDDPTRSEQNPLLFNAPNGATWLLWTAQIAGRQDTAIIRRRVSDDGGHHWGAIETLFEAQPGFGTFIRQPLVVARDGAWLLPIWRCTSPPHGPWTGDLDTSSVMRSTDGGRRWTEHAVPDSRGCVHMALLDLADGTMLALYRSRWADRIYASRSGDAGRTWSVPAPTGLRNNNSSIAATVLVDGRIALVFNDSSAAEATGRRLSLYDDIGGEEPPPPTAASAFWGAPRAPLTLALSEDGGLTWPHRRNLETGDGYCMTNNSAERLNREFSYPSVVQAPDGCLDIAYTFWRQAIKHVRVQPDWARG